MSRIIVLHSLDLLRDTRNAPAKSNANREFGKGGLALKVAMGADREGAVSNFLWNSTSSASLRAGFWATEESKDGALDKIKGKSKIKIKIKGKIKGCGRGRPLYMYGLLGEGAALGFFSQGG